MSKLGLGRFIISATDKDNIEVYDTRYFEDGFITDVTDISCREIDNNLIEPAFTFRECVVDIFEKNSIAFGKVIEVIAEIHAEDTSSWTDCGYEYDWEIWLEDIKHRVLNEYQEKRFASLEEDDDENESNPLCET